MTTETFKTETIAVDLSGFLPVDESTLEILTADGRKTGWNIRLAGPSHPKTIALNDSVARKELFRQKQIEQAQVNGKKYKSEEKTPDEARRETVQSIVGRIIGWNPIDIGTGPIEFSEKAAEDLLIKPEMGWAYVQIAEAFGDEKRFTPRSGTK